MFIGYQDLELSVYDDESQDFYGYLEDREPQEEDEFNRCFSRRRRRSSRPRVIARRKRRASRPRAIARRKRRASRPRVIARRKRRSSKPRVIARRKRRSSKPRVIARRKRRASRPKVVARRERRSQKVAARREKRDIKRVSKGKSPKYLKRSVRPVSPVLSAPLKRKLPKNWGSPIMAPVKSVPKIRNITTAPVKSPLKPKGKSSSKSQKAVVTNTRVDSNHLPTRSSERIDNLEERIETDTPKQAGMGKGIIWGVVIVGSLIVATKVITGKKTSEIVKVKPAA